jgi:hypothetical protein
MKTLYAILFRHYSQKDNKVGMVGLFVTNEGDLAVADHVHEQYDNYLLSDEDFPDDEEEACINPADWFWAEDPGAEQRALDLGLRVERKGWGDNPEAPSEVYGNHRDLVIWWRGDYREVSDLYYGATQYSWKPLCEIDEDAEYALRRLGLIGVIIDEHD